MNIVKNRLNNLGNNQFKHRINKIVRDHSGILKSEPYEFKYFNFNGNLHSEKIEKEKFTNYLSSYENTLYSLLENIFNKLQKDEYDFLKEFELDEYKASEYTEEYKRLKRIIATVNGIEDVNKLPKIDKFKPVKHLRKEQKRYDGIRLFVHTGKDGIIDLYLVDLYHLGIDAFNYRTGHYDLTRNYNSTKEYHKCISKIADNYI